MRDGTPRTRAELIRADRAGPVDRGRPGRRPPGDRAARRPSGEAASTGGRPPARFAFNPDAGVVLGADLGATHAPGGPDRPAGAVIAEKALRRSTSRGSPAGARLGRAHGPLAARPPPVVPATTSSASASVSPGRWSTPRAARPSRRSCPAGTTTTCPVTSQALGGPVLVDNDVNVMALGEHATIYPDVAAPHLRQGRHRHRRRHHQRWPAAPGRPGRGRRPRPRRRAARRRHPLHLRQRRLPRGRGEWPGHREGSARERDRRRRQPWPPPARQAG